MTYHTVYVNSSLTQVLLYVRIINTMPIKKRLTPRDKVFVKEYVKHGNGSEAVREAYDVKETSVGNTAHRKLQQAPIQEEIKRVMEQHEITPEWLIMQRKRLVSKGMEDVELGKSKVQASDVEKHLTRFEELLGMSGVMTKLNQHLHLHQATNTQVHQAKVKQSSYFKDIKE